MKIIDRQSGQFALKMVGQAVLILALATLLTRGCFRLVEQKSTSSNTWLRRRTVEAISAIKDLPVNGISVFLFGASEIEIGFHPKSFEDAVMEKAGVNLNAYNFGFRNLDPRLQRLFARRVMEERRSSGGKINFAIVNFSPLRSTSRYTSQLFDYKVFRHFEDIEAAVYSPAMMQQDLFGNLDEITHVWMTKNLFAGISSISAAGDLWFLLTENAISFMRSQKWHYGEDRTDKWKRYSELNYDTWSNPLLHDGPAWDVEQRGYFFFGYPKHEQQIAQLAIRYQDPKMKRINFAAQNSFGDFDEMRFDEGSIADFISTLKDFQGSADHVMVLLLPVFIERQLSKAASDHIEEVLVRIRQETSAKILNYSKNKVFMPSDFLDDLHLNISGQKKLSLLLAQDLAADLGRN